MLEMLPSEEQAFVRLQTSSQQLALRYSKTCLVEKEECVHQQQHDHRMACVPNNILRSVVSRKFAIQTNGEFPTYDGTYLVYR